MSWGEASQGGAESACALQLWRGGRGRREGKEGGGKAVSIQSKPWSSLQDAQSTGCSRPERRRCQPVLGMPSSPHGYHRACLASDRTMLTATPQHTSMPQTAPVTPAPAFNSPTKLRLGAPAPKNNLNLRSATLGAHLNHQHAQSSDDSPSSSCQACPSHPTLACSPMHHIACRPPTLLASPAPSSANEKRSSQLQETNAGCTPEPPARPQQRQQPLCTRVRQ